MALNLLSLGLLLELHQVLRETDMDVLFPLRGEEVATTLQEEKSRTTSSFMSFCMRLSNDNDSNNMAFKKHPVFLSSLCFPDNVVIGISTFHKHMHLLLALLD